MHVLITGYNYRHTQVTPRIQAYASFLEALVRVHARVDDVVERRQVTPGEDLSHYDRVYVGLGPITPRIATGVLGALWALTERPDAVGFLDDALGHQFRLPCMCDPRYLGRPHHVGNREARPYWSALERTLDSLRYGWRGPVLVPVHGTHLDRAFWDTMTMGGRPILLNPGSLFLGDYPIPSSTRDQKRRRWVVAGLTNTKVHVEPLAWDRVTVTRESRVTEEQLVSGLYTGSWGLISPSIVGTRNGWWRARFLFSALAGCVTVVHPREQVWTPGLYPTALEPVEQATEPELRLLASNQAHEYLTTLPPSSQVTRVILNLKEEK